MADLRSLAAELTPVGGRRGVRTPPQVIDDGPHFCGLLHLEEHDIRNVKVIHLPCRRIKRLIAS